MMLMGMKGKLMITQVVKKTTQLAERNFQFWQIEWQRCIFLCNGEN